MLICVFAALCTFLLVFVASVIAEHTGMNVDRVLIMACLSCVLQILARDDVEKEGK